MNIQQQQQQQQQQESLKVWEKLITIFSIPSHNEIVNNNIDQKHTDLKSLFNSIKHYNLSNLVIEWYFESIKKYFQTSLSNEFWKFFTNVNLNDLESTSGRQLKFINNQFALSINLLHKVFSYFTSNLLLFQQNLFKKSQLNFKFLIKKLQNLLITNLMYSTQQSKYFNTILFMFFERDFISFTKSFYHSKKQLKSTTTTSSLMETGQEEEEIEEEELESSYVMEMSFEDSITDINIKEDSFMDLCKKLHDLNLIVISEEIFTQILFKKIFEYIENKCKGEFEKRFLNSILEWADQVIFKWLSMILLSYNHNSSGNGNNNNNIIDQIEEEEEEDNNNSIFNQWKTRLEFSIYENYSQQRISELFDMIVQYPDSIPALEDLSICFQKIPMVEKTMITNLKKVLHSRLLHPGANTNDIITQYISTIHSMNIIDPSGNSLIIDKVGKPIREYLSQREDTIRCIVSSFTDESNEIYQEFCNFDPDDHIDNHHINYYSNGNTGLISDGLDLYVDEIDTFNSNDYQLSSSTTTSTTSPLAGIKSKKKKKDTISHLVNIYDGVEVFINEYRSMLADRLLSVVDFNLDKEIKNVELLKLRFGETLLFNCEIMIKDMSDSKRLNTQIKSATNGNGDISNFETLILSQLYWPTLKGDQFKYPEEIENKMKLYSIEYERIKTPRQLIWKQHLGLVDLDLEIVDGEIQSFQVSPIHASIIMLFSSNDRTSNPEISLDYISKQLDITKDIVKKKLTFWLNNQILKECSFEKYKINNKTSKQQQQQQQQDDQDQDSSDDEDSNENEIIVEEEEEIKSTSQKEKEESMRVVESFIIGMLINFKALPLERIHSMLTMFNSDQYTSTIQELKSFLSKLINEEKIDLTGNDYKIKK